MIKIIDQRKQYLENLKKETREFWLNVVADYNGGMNAKEIAAKYINPRTQRPYSRQHIHAIIRKMREKL